MLFNLLLLIILIVIDWVKHNLLSLLVSVGTLLTAFFAYRSARMSEQANKANFSPLIIPLAAGLNNNYFWLQLKNISVYHNAYAKKVKVFLDGVHIDEIETVGPEQVHHTNVNLTVNNEGSHQISILYFDIVDNKFETKFILGKTGNRLDYFNVSNWKYMQY